VKKLEVRMTPRGSGLHQNHVENSLLYHTKKEYWFYDNAVVELSSDQLFSWLVWNGRIDSVSRLHLN